MTLFIVKKLISVVLSGRPITLRLYVHWLYILFYTHSPPSSQLYSTTQLQQRAFTIPFSLSLYNITLKGCQHKNARNFFFANLKKI